MSVDIFVSEEVAKVLLKIVVVISLFPESWNSSYVWKRQLSLKNAFVKPLINWQSGFLSFSICQFESFHQVANNSSITENCSTSTTTETLHYVNVSSTKSYISDIWLPISVHCGVSYRNLPFILLWIRNDWFLYKTEDWLEMGS